MTLVIHKTPDPAKLIRMGRGSVDVAESPSEPSITQTKKRGRPKMADKKLTDETGTETIRKDDADEKGAIGSHGENAPAQEKVPEKGEKEDA